MDHVLIDNDYMDLTDEELHRLKDNKTRKRWCLFISVSFMIVTVVCFGVWYISDLTKPRNSNNSVTENVVLHHSQYCDTCAMLPNFEDYCIGSTCSFDKNDDKTVVCPSGYGDIQIYKVKFGGHTRSEATVLLQTECSGQMLESGVGQCDFNVAELQGTEEEEPMNEEETGEEFVEEEETVMLQHHHEDPNSVKIYYLCNKLEETTEPTQLMLSSPLDVQDEEFPFLSVALVKCNTREWKADYLEGGKACSKDGSFNLQCRDDGTDPRIIVVKAHAKDEGTLPTDPVEKKAAKKAKKKSQKKMAANANDMCGEQGAGQCSFSLSDIVKQGDAIPTGKFKVEYLCSYGAVIEDNSAEAPLLLGNPYYYEDETFPMLTATLVSCNANKPVGSYVENGKACAADELVLQCDASRNPRIVIAKVHPERVGPKETDPTTKKQNKDNGKERTLRANNICGNPDNIVDGACTLALSDVLLETDSLEEGQLMDVKFFCSYDTAAEI